MTFTLSEKKLYDVENKDGMIESHYRRKIMTIGEGHFFMLYEEDYCEIITYASIIKMIG